MTQPVFALYKGFWKILDWVFPPECAGCGKLGWRWCTDCDQAVKIISDPICQICGEPIFVGTICENCRKDRPVYTQLRSWAKYDVPISGALKQLKYDNNLGLAEIFSRRLQEILVKMEWKVDVVIPVPLNKQRMANRGYNQSGLLAKPLAFSYHLPLHNNGLKRIINTRSQVGLSAEERKANVENAFAFRGKLLNGENILLVDDITTTGSTISACSKVLKEAGAGEIFGLTVARTTII